MSELIKREDAIKATWHEPSYIDPYNILTEVRDRIEALPTVDAVPVKFIYESADLLRKCADEHGARVLYMLIENWNRADGERRTDETEGS